MLWLLIEVRVRLGLRVRVESCIWRHLTAVRAETLLGFGCGMSRITDNLTGLSSVDSNIRATQLSSYSKLQVVLNTAFHNTTQTGLNITSISQVTVDITGTSGQWSFHTDLGTVTTTHCFPGPVTVKQ